VAGLSYGLQTAEVVDSPPVARIVNPNAILRTVTKNQSGHRCSARIESAASCASLFPLCRSHQLRRYIRKAARNHILQLSFRRRRRNDRPSGHPNWKWHEL